MVVPSLTEDGIIHKTCRNQVRGELRRIELIETSQYPAILKDECLGSTKSLVKEYFAKLFAQSSRKIELPSVDGLS
jgi:hypothetical protein